LADEPTGARPVPPAPPTPPERREHYWLKAAALLAAFGVIGLVLWQTGLVRFFLDQERLTRFIESLGVWGWVGFVALQAGQVVAAPIPGEATGLLGGYLYGPFLGIVLSTIGLTAGSLAAFALAHFFGRPLVERFVAAKTIERFDYLLGHRGSYLVLLLFMLPGFPKDYLCYILGLTHMKWPRFLVVAGLGRVFGTVLLTLGGTYLHEKEYGHLFILAGAAVVVVGLGLAYRDRMEQWFRRWHDRQ
jgi:uncharacterized membrane protein YdjX (TVP38/TMEM64 family)